MAKTFATDLKRKRKDPLDVLAPTQETEASPAREAPPTDTEEEQEEQPRIVDEKPKPQNRQKKKKSARVGRPPKHTVDLERFTVKLKQDVLTDIRAIAYWDRKTVQDIFWEALEQVVEEYPEAELRKARRAFKKSQ